MEKNKRLKTLTGMVVFAWMLVLVISNVIIGVISYALYSQQLLEARTEEAMNVAVSVAVRIDGEKFTQIMDTLEKDEYWHEIKAYTDNVAAVFGATYVYILDDDYTDKVTYFMEASLHDEPFDLGVTEVIEGVYADEMFDTLRTGETTFTKPYPSGEYGSMVSGFAAIKDGGGKVAGVVGVDFIYGDIQQVLNRFALSMAGIILAFLVLCYFLMTYLGTKMAGKPLSDLDAAAQRLSAGDMDVSLAIRSSTEIGRLAASFSRMVDTMKEQVAALEVLSQGDLTPDIRPRSEKDIMGVAIGQILTNLNGMFAEINQSALMVSSGARQISDNSQSMAQGALEQSDAIESLHASISDMTAKAKENLKVAVTTNNLTDAIKADAQTGSEHMNHMTLAVREIADASISISKVIKVIDDIAFQTNVLALNASVEAARAGQHGRGFAVVAEEVRNLAAKSAEAAKDTERLISDSMEKAKLGAEIAERTADSLGRIIQGVNECAALMGGIAGAFERQIQAMVEINQGVAQVSQVVQQNKAAAGESATASQEMSHQSEVLEELLSNFKLKENAGGRAAMPPPSKARRLQAPGDSSAYGKY